MHSGQTILRRYRVLEIIGRGGQAIVAKAVDLQTGLAVAIKMLATPQNDPIYQEQLDRFLRAARVRIGHPAVVDPITHGQEGDNWYMVMPFVDGSDLCNYVDAAGGRLAVRQAVGIARQVAAGLGAMHGKGKIHRDIKPSNILICLADGSARVCDLGICRDLRSVTIVAGSRPIGTPAWMSPEHIQTPQAVGPQSDLYCLGAVLYWMLTGCELAQGQDVATVKASICYEQPTPPRTLDPAIPAYVDQACMKLLAKDVRSRFQTASEFCDALAAGEQKDSRLSLGRCIRCTGSLASQTRFCPHCGTMQFTAPALVHCLACGTLIDNAAACPSCRRPFSFINYRLYFTAGPLAGRMFRIPQGDYCVGRQQFLDIDPCISRRHLRVDWQADVPRISDAGSANKTYVAGVPAAAPFRLFPGCTVGVAGNTAIVMAN